MPENHTPSPAPDKLSSKLKTMAVQGLLGAVSLTAAAVIPLLAQRFLSPSPVTPASVVPGAISTEAQPQISGEPQINAQPEERQRGRHRNKPKEDDDD